MYAHRWLSRAGRLADRLPLVSSLNRLLYRRAFASNVHENLFLGRYASFDEAKRAAPQTKPLGYDNAQSAGVYGDQLKPRDYPAVFWLGRILGAGARHVFDLGGHTGIKYAAFQTLLDYPADLDWTVGEVPAVAEEGRRLALAQGLDRLFFTDDLSALAKADVLFASGSVQFLDESPAALMTRVGARPRWVLLNTSAINPRLSYITLNSIGSAFCPYRVQSRDSLVSELNALGYVLRDEWRNPGKGMQVPFHPELSIEEYRGFCFERIDAA